MKSARFFVINIKSTSAYDIDCVNVYFLFHLAYALVILVWLNVRIAKKKQTKKNTTR